MVWYQPGMSFFGIRSEKNNVGLLSPCTDLFRYQLNVDPQTLEQCLSYPIYAACRLLCFKQ